MNELVKKRFLHPLIPSAPHPNSKPHILGSQINTASLNTTDLRARIGHNRYCRVLVTALSASLLALVDFLWSKLAARCEVTMRVHDRFAYACVDTNACILAVHAW